MREAIVPLGATAVLAFVVHRWLGDELERERRLSPAAANAALALFVLHALLTVIAALGGVLSVDAPPAPARGAGLAVAALGAALAGAALTALGSRERILAMRTDVVVRHGPYRYSRHPFYLGWTLVLLGIAVAGTSGLALGLVALLTVALVRIARGEERWLRDEMGAAYESYRKRAPAVVGRPRAVAAR
jgi:protein-S-isoprenylcysteine O-methyltransferase Ste14